MTREEASEAMRAVRVATEISPRHERVYSLRAADIAFVMHGAKADRWRLTRNRYGASGSTHSTEALVLIHEHAPLIEGPRLRVAWFMVRA